MLKLLTCLLFFFSLSAFAEPQVFTIWKDNKAPIDTTKFENTEVKVSVYIPKKNSGKAIVICPGGGYGGHAIKPEGFGIAEWLNKHGIVGIVLKYRLPKNRKFVPLYDVNRAIRFTRFHAEKFGIYKNKVGVLGFSAGGHLASTALVHQLDCPTKDEISKENAKPNFGVLIYPVITMGKDTHKGSKIRLIGKNPSEEDLKFFSTELRVSTKTPPTFLAHAIDDKPVPPSNSKMFHDNLK